MKSLSLSKPHLIIMVGIPGSGKSFFAEHFAETFKAPLISFHRFRYELFNDPTLSKDENEIISRVAEYMLDELLKTGRTIIYEGESSSRNDRAIITKISRSAGYEPLFVWVQTDPITAQKRALKPNNDKPPITIEQFNAEVKRFSVPHMIEKAVVISGKHPYSSQLKIVLKRLIEPRAHAENKPVLERQPISRNFLIR